MMFLVDAFRLALKSLSERRLRAALTIVGIAIGPLALVMMTSVVQGYSDYVIKQIESLGQNLIVVSPSEDFELTEKDLDFFRSLNGVARAEPFYATRGTISYGGREKEVYIYALPIDMLFEAIGSLKILYGSQPSSSEITKAVVGYNIAFNEYGEQLYNVGDVLSLTIYRVESGGNLKVRKCAVLISAILDKYGGAFLLSPDDTVFLPLDAGSKLLGLKEWSGILILAEDPAYVANITRIINEKYRDSVNVISFLAVANIVSSVTGAMNFIAFSTSLSAFAVAVAGIAATMITSVIERTREIGVMKAVGFTDKQVLIMILLESIVMSLIGGAVGIMLGIVGAHILASKGFVIRGVLQSIVIKASPAITPELVLKTIGITIAVGIMGGIFPAYRAAKIPPAVALRYE